MNSKEAVATIIGMAGLIWLGPLMIDQFVLFGDQEQTRRAAESRVLMLPASALTLASASILLASNRAWHAVVVALPATAATTAAWLWPNELYQLIAFVLLAPLAAGALLSTAAPLPRDVPVLVRLLTIATALAFGMVGSPFVAMLGLIGVAAWWRLSLAGRRGASALD